MATVTVTRDNIDYTTTLVTHACCTCGVPFAMPADLERRAREDSDVWFWCCNGHQAHYADDELARTKRMLSTARERARMAEAQNTHLRDQRQAAQRSAAAYKGQLTRVRKRIGNGVCPCCHRQFRQVTAHMERMHPGYADAKVQESP